MPFKIHLRIFGIGAALLAILPLSANAWTNHAYLTTPALGGQPEYREEVSAEPLDSFLLKEKVKIGELLKAEEAWAVSNVRAYPAAPQTLDFLSSKETNLRIRFLKALRVNPDLEMPLFVMRASRRVRPAKNKTLAEVRRECPVERFSEKHLHPARSGRKDKRPGSAFFGFRRTGLRIGYRPLGK